MTNKQQGQRETTLILVVLGAVVVSPLIAFLGFVLWTSGIGPNRTTFVVLCAVLAVIGYFWLWLRKGIVFPGKQGPAIADQLKEMTFREKLLWAYRQDWPHRYIGMLLGFLGLFLGIAYAEYGEAIVKWLQK